MKSQIGFRKSLINFCKSCEMISQCSFLGFSHGLYGAAAWVIVYFVPAMVRVVARALAVLLVPTV